MKRNNLLNYGIIALVSLLIGFLIGYFVTAYPPNEKDLAGTIGKVERYRNVKTSENDILLRNELLQDTLKQKQYWYYLSYNYRKALLSGKRLEEAMAVTSEIPAFAEVQAEFTPRMENFSKYLEVARLDILKALEVMTDIDPENKEPIVDYLNLAINAISRLQQFDVIWTDYTAALGEFLQVSEKGAYPKLANLHDALLLDLVESALITQNKPMLKYMNKQAFRNDKDGLMKVINSQPLELALKNQLVADMQGLSSSAMGSRFDSHEALNLSLQSVLQTGFTLNGSRLMSQGISSMENKLGLLVLDVDKLNFYFETNKLGLVYGQESLGGIIWTDFSTLEGVILLNRF